MGRGFLELNLSSIYEPRDYAVYFLQLKSLGGRKNIHTVSAALYLLHCICCIVSAALYLLHGWAVDSMR